MSVEDNKTDAQPYAFHPSISAIAFIPIYPFSATTHQFSCAHSEHAASMINFAHNTSPNPGTTYVILYDTIRKCLHGTIQRCYSTVGNTR